jgi:hypothetical protein
MTPEQARERYKLEPAVLRAEGEPATLTAGVPCPRAAGSSRTSRGDAARDGNAGQAHHRRATREDRATSAESRRRWRWRTIRNPWPGPERVPHPLADRRGQVVRELCRGRNGNALLEFEDGLRVVAPWRAAL